MFTPPRVRNIQPDLCHLTVYEDLMTQHELWPALVEALCIAHNLVDLEIHASAVAARLEQEGRSAAAK